MEENLGRDAQFRATRLRGQYCDDRLPAQTF
jgi:hypothetical protein